jgi:phosphate-selective porin OprO and OprP
MAIMQQRLIALALAVSAIAGFVLPRAVQGQSVTSPRIALDPAARAQVADQHDRRIRDLERELARLKAQIAQLKRDEASAPHDTELAWVTAPRWRTADGTFSFKPRARIDLDAAQYDAADGALDHDNGVMFRRARLGAIGRAYGSIAYKIEGDFADGTGRLKDAYVAFDGPRASLQVGHFAAPFTIGDSATSFMERSLPVEAFRTGRKIGAAINTRGSTWTAAIGTFGDAASRTGVHEGGWSINARATFAPLVDEQRAVHLGAAAYYRKEDEDQIRLRSHPEVWVDSRTLVSTGDLPLDHSQFLGVEAAGMLGSSVLIAEWDHLTIARPSLADLSFDGGSVSLSHRLTADRQQYRGDQGIFVNAEPSRHLGNGGCGAWEVAIRYSWLDLQDVDVRGGLQRDVTLAVNWYFLPGARLQLNTVLFDIRDSFADPPISAAGNPAGGDLRGAVHALRLQMVW